METNASSSMEFGQISASQPVSDPVGREARLRLLQLVAEGEISAEEAAERLASGEYTPAPAIPGSYEPQPDVIEPGAAPAKSGKARWFRVRVTDTFSGRSKATISIPLGIVDWGLRIGARFNPDIKGFHLEELGGLLRSGQEGLLVDVMNDEDGEHVEIFVD